MKTKVCSKCKVEKGVEVFSKHSGHKEGLQSQCRECDSVCKKVYHEANREKEKARNKAYYEANREKIQAKTKAYYEVNREKELARIKAYREVNREKVLAWYKIYDKTTRYGLLPGQYETMLVEQGHVCKICFQACKVNERLSIDHCHTSGKVRGLLCNNCNSGLGKAKDSPSLLRAAAEYLRKYQSSAA